jgi:hypothetical protein
MCLLKTATVAVLGIKGDCFKTATVTVLGKEGDRFKTATVAVLVFSLIVACFACTGL